MIALRLIFVLVSFCGAILCDTIANCTYEDARGNWNFFESSKTGDSSLDCLSWMPTNATAKIQFRLEHPNVVFDQDENRGYWTLIYNQGFEIVINFRKYFVYFYYDKTSYDCSKTMPGWSHDVTVRNWACIQAVKTNRVPPVEVLPTPSNGDQDALFQNDHKFIERINRQQNSWKAKAYPHFEKMTVAEISSMTGGIKQFQQRAKPQRPNHKTRLEAAQLPKSFDWRNVNGQNFVSPVRAQGTCGSCYAFASMALLEARVRVASNNRQQPVFSTQDIVSCSKYSQGCSGGFPYLIAGKYAQDYGVVAEECNPYKGVETPTCTTNKTCSRTYTADYKYIGGYYGACNEELMRIALVKNGPIAVSFEVYPDLKQYNGGIYHHTDILPSSSTTMPTFNPFEITNHVVLIVGYGADNQTAEKYWIVKNSWGEEWGENGFFRIRRGTDECGIESIAVEVFPIV